MPKIRTTLTIDQDVLARYQAMAILQGESLSATVSSWLDVSADSAEFLAQQVAKAKRSPDLPGAVARMAETFAVMEDVYRQSVEAGKGGRPATGADSKRSVAASGGGRPVPPSCNTGGKVPRTKNRAPA